MYLWERVLLIVQEMCILSQQQQQPFPFFFSLIFPSPRPPLCCRIDDPLLGTTIVGVVNVLATYAVLFLMDRCGRRTLILWSAAGMFLSSVVIVLTLLGVFEKIGTFFFFLNAAADTMWIVKTRGRKRLTPPQNTLGCVHLPPFFYSGIVCSQHLCHFL